LQLAAKSINIQDLAAENPSEDAGLQTFPNTLPTTTAIEIDLNEYEQWYLKK
jgi:hypothetical protein